MMSGAHEPVDFSELEEDDEPGFFERHGEACRFFSVAALIVLFVALMFALFTPTPIRHLFGITTTENSMEPMSWRDGQLFVMKRGYSNHVLKLKKLYRVVGFDDRGNLLVSYMDDSPWPLQQQGKMLTTQITLKWLRTYVKRGDCEIVAADSKEYAAQITALTSSTAMAAK